MMKMDIKLKVLALELKIQKNLAVVIGNNGGIYMIYTSYFSKLKKLPKDIIPVSICAKAPSWYDGLEYKKLAPSYDILMQYKSNPNEEVYIKRFKEEILNKRLPSQTVVDLLALVGNFKGLNYSPSICLVCYEKPTDFCHRHLVADWLKENGYSCEEINL
jgi:uncharacterized protein YeaO (DUF488 family)